MAFKPAGLLMYPANTELVNYWNSSLANKIEVETEMYPTHLVLTNKDDKGYVLPCIDYDSTGFPKKGVTAICQIYKIFICQKNLTKYNLLSAMCS
jgi:hypothetical protein